MVKVPIFQDSILISSVNNKELDETIVKILQNEMQDNKGNFFSKLRTYTII